MFQKQNEKFTDSMNCRSLFIALIVILAVASIGMGQSPTPTPENSTFSGYDINSRIEIGVRGLETKGNSNKFRSDLNYRNGIRLFDSSFSMTNKEGRKRFIDQLSFNSSGWGSDRSGYARLSMEGYGMYKFTGNFRRISYFNNLNNTALNQHNFNTNRDMGDVDLSVTPFGDKLRFTFGGSYNIDKGPGMTNARAYRDDFAVLANIKNNSNDFRFGVDGTLFGFNLGMTYGYRKFNERTTHYLDGPSNGNNTADTTTYSSFSRVFPNAGKASFTAFNIQRTFAKRVDFTGRFIYSDTDATSSLVELISGRDGFNNRLVDLDRFEINGDSRRIQIRGDIGFTFLITKDFTISETFSIDRFGIDAGENLYNLQTRRSLTGTLLGDFITRSAAYRATDFRRMTNLIEGDYQIRNWVGLHLGYRFTDRRVEVNGWDLTIQSANVASTITNPFFACSPSRSGQNPYVPCEDEENKTHTVIAGMKIKPTKWWALFWDMEHGSADNVFTRVENYKFTNFRIRSRWTFDKFVFSASAISKDNTNPTRSDILGVDFGASSKTRIFSGAFDWSPNPKFSLSSGYTYTHQTSAAAVVIFAPSPTRLQGVSQWFVRDSDFYLDINYKPNKWVSFFGSYRHSNDRGQGSRPLTDPYPILIGNSTTTLLRPQDMVNSYPMSFQSPEFRVALRLTKNIDWNFGYQYYNYEEKFQLLQDYRAHLPYTSLRIYFGNNDR